MKFILMTMLGLVLAGNSLRAEEVEAPDATALLSIVMCADDTESLLKYLESKFGEKPLAELTTSIMLQGAVPGATTSIVPGAGALTVNPKTGTYSLIMRIRNSKAACVVSTGIDFRPYGAQPKKNENKLKM